MIVTFISGSMFGRKSKTLINMIKKAQEHYEAFLVYKPTNDTRDGMFVRSRDLRALVPATPWDVNHPAKSMNDFRVMVEEMVKYNEDHVKKSVFIDEGHFISVGEMMFIVETCQQLNVNLYVSGLDTDFMQQTFPSTNYLRKVTDNYLFFHGECDRCGLETAVYNVLLGEHGEPIAEGQSIHPGDSEYVVVCPECL